MGYKAAVQVLQKAEDLKTKLLRKCDLLNDSEAWTDQQQLQTIYHQVLVLDLEYALDKKVEQELWTLGFKNHISTLQEMARDKKNPKRSESQALLSWCLEAASGFYLTLLQELCTAFELNFPFRKPGSVYGITKSQTTEQISFPQSSSCLYICQYCLVHLGDIARYRNQRQQAESFYKQAIMVSPTSGHPYNQLALLEASQGDKFSTVFYYVRAIAVKNPFPAATTNLLNTLNATIDKESPITKVQSKMSVNEFLQLFLCLHGFLHTATELNQAEIAVKSINSTLTALVATQSFTADKLVKMTVINLYTLKNIVGSDISQLTDDERKVRRLILDLLAGSLSAFLIPVHTLKTDETLLSYYALPSIKLLTYWIINESSILQEDVFTSRLQIWPSLCKLLNHIQEYLKDFDYNKYVTTPLPEDRELQGFLPLSENFKDFDFGAKEIENQDTEKLVRAKRLLNFATWLADMSGNNSQLLISKKNDDILSFEPACTQPDPTEGLLEEIKSLSVAEISENTNKLKGVEKKGGILKPQGSLEKSREEREQSLLTRTDSKNIQLNNSNVTIATKLEPTKLKRARQNVALQSIFKKMEENKQVKFNVETSELEKEEKKPIKFESALPSKPLTNTPHMSQPFRTQTFNQNHPALSVIQNDDYMRSTFHHQPQIPIDKIPPLPFPKNDFPNLMSQNLPYSHPNSQSFNMNQTSMSFSQNVSNNQSNFNNMPSMNQQLPPPPMPYQNVSLPQTVSHNTWKHEDNQSVSNWWLPPNVQMPQNKSYQQPDNYPVNYQYSSNLPSYHTPNNDFMNKPQNTQANVDVFTSPWSNTSRNPLSSQGMMGFENHNQNLSMRQAMLKETSNLSTVGSMSSVTVSHGNNIPPTDNKYMQMPTNTPGYSLFNTSSWAPNLPGQLRNLSGLSDNLRQQSLFSSQGPNTLAQLVEQQNLQKNDS